MCTSDKTKVKMLHKRCRSTGPQSSALPSATSGETQRRPPAEDSLCGAPWCQTMMSKVNGNIIYIKLKKMTFVAENNIK